ncbi:MAG: hypothetical protein ACRDQA_02505 [Nocardioidaceae bacterium]
MSTTTAVDTKVKLYRLTSVIDGWPHRDALYDGVKVEWFVEDRPVPVGDYRQLLSPYREEARFDGQGTIVAGSDLVDELFTAEEAEQFAEYLKTAHDEDVTRTEVELPRPLYNENGAEYLSVGSVPVGGGTDFHMLSHQESYELPFKVWGYYRVEGKFPAKVRVCSHECEHHEPIDRWRDFVPPAAVPASVDPWAF